MADRHDTEDKILSAALALAADDGWRWVSMAAVAARAGVPLADLRDHFPSKVDLLAGLLLRTDQQVLAGGLAEPGEPARDRLFDVLMRRFDALTPDRDGVAAVLRDLPTDPLAIALLAPRFLTSMAWMLEAAGLSAQGLAGAARVKGLAVVYLDALRVWLRDDSEDLARTMAALDRGLRRAEGLARALPLFGAADQGEPIDSGDAVQAPANG